MKIDISFIFIKLYQEHRLLCEFVFAVRSKLMNGKYWHGPKNISDFSHSQAPLVQTNTAENLWTLWCLNLTLKFAAAIWNRNFKIIQICPKRTRNVQLSMCKKHIFSPSRHQWLLEKEREREEKKKKKTIKGCFYIVFDRELIASLDRESLCLFRASMLVSSVPQVLLSSPWSASISGEERGGNKWLSEWVQCLWVRVDRDGWNHLSL